MAMISYAQNYEDVMLWRALKHIKNGFYIDIGAAWPEYDSVTAHFYNSDWIGVNIEPNPNLFKLITASRPNDINLNIAISNKVGNAEITILENPGLSTLDTKIAADHIKDYGFKSSLLNVEISTLNCIFDKYVPKNQPVHFLKIDVEGAEKLVVEGNDWQKNRPWILLVESTSPMSQVENHTEWEKLVLSNQYQFLYFDGLNRFYVADEHMEVLSPAFINPPNVFDAFKLSRVVALESEVSLYHEGLDERAEEIKKWSEIVEGRAKEIEIWSTTVEKRGDEISAWSKAVEDHEKALDFKDKALLLKDKEINQNLLDSHLQVRESQLVAKEALISLREVSVELQRVNDENLLFSQSISELKEQLYHENLLSSQSISELKEQLYHENLLSSQSISELKEQLNESLNKAHFWWVEAENRQAFISQLRNSTSWRVSTPIRVVKRLYLKLINALFTKVKENIKTILKNLVVIVFNFPVFSKKLNKLVRMFPNLHNHLRFFANHHGLVSVSGLSHNISKSYKTNDDQTCDTQHVVLQIKLKSISWHWSL